MVSCPHTPPYPQAGQPSINLARFFKVLTFNVRGLLNYSKLAAIKRLVSQYDLIFLQEIHGLVGDEKYFLEEFKAFSGIFSFSTERGKAGTVIFIANSLLKQMCISIPHDRILFSECSKLILERKIVCGLPGGQFRVGGGGDGRVALAAFSFKNINHGWCSVYAPCAGAASLKAFFNREGAGICGFLDKNATNIVAGDWNFIESPDDRIDPLAVAPEEDVRLGPNLQTVTQELADHLASGRPDNKVCDSFSQHIAEPLFLSDRGTPDSPSFRHCASKAFFRLDRFYVSCHEGIPPLAVETSIAASGVFKHSDHLPMQLVCKSKESSGRARFPPYIFSTPQFLPKFEKIRSRIAQNEPQSTPALAITARALQETAKILLANGKYRVYDNIGKLAVSLSLLKQTVSFANDLKLDVIIKYLGQNPDLRKFVKFEIGAVSFLEEALVLGRRALDDEQELSYKKFYNKWELERAKLKAACDVEKEHASGVVADLLHIMEEDEAADRENIRASVRLAVETVDEEYRQHFTDLEISYKQELDELMQLMAAETIATLNNLANKYHNTLPPRVTVDIIALRAYTHTLVQTLKVGEGEAQAGVNASAAEGVGLPGDEEEGPIPEMLKGLSGTQATGMHPIAVLKALNASNTEQIQAVRNADGEVVRTPGEVAKAQTCYWEGVWEKREIDTQALNCTVDEFLKSKGLADPFDFKIERQDIRFFLRMCKGRSSPGPDGLPFGAWQVIEKRTFHEIIEFVQLILGDIDNVSKNGSILARKFINNFNTAFLFLIPKKGPTGLDPLMGMFYDCKDTRGLSVSDTVNRLVAGAYKTAAERVMPKGWFSEELRGFIAGRNGTDNIIDLNCFFYDKVQQALKSELEGGKISEKSFGYLLFFDFAAAYPSVSHQTLFCLVEKVFGSEACHIFKFLHQNCDHSILLPKDQSGKLQGPSLFNGIKQGCPLSPFIFLLVTEILLFLLRKKLKEGNQQVLVRFFADDLGMGFGDPRILEQLPEVFDFFSQITGMKLNINKTFLLASSPEAELMVEGILTRIGWDQIQIVQKATYLGCVFGRNVQLEDVFGKCIDKLLARLAAWSKPFSLGARVTIINTFVLPILSYLWQFYILDDIIIKSFRSAIHRFLSRLFYCGFYCFVTLGQQAGVPSVADFELQNLAAVIRVFTQRNRNKLEQALNEVRRYRVEYPYEDWGGGHHYLNQVNLVFRKFEEVSGVSFEEFLEPCINDKLPSQHKVYCFLKKRAQPEREKHWHKSMARWVPKCVDFPKFTFQNLKGVVSTLKSKIYNLVYKFLPLLFNGLPTWRRVKDFSREILKKDCPFCGKKDANEIEHWVECATIQIAWQRTLQFLNNTGQDDQVLPEHFSWETLLLCFDAKERNISKKQVSRILFFVCSVINCFYACCFGSQGIIVSASDHIWNGFKFYIQKFAASIDTYQAERALCAKCQKKLNASQFYCNVCSIRVCIRCARESCSTCSQTFKIKPGSISGNTIYLFTDGGADMPGRKTAEGVEIPPLAGWGFTILNSQEGVIGGGFGPVELNGEGCFFSGAQRATNNCAEVLALRFGLEMVRKLRMESPEVKKVVLIPDSKFAAQIISGCWASKTPHLWDSIDKAKSEYNMVKRLMQVTWKIVPGHAGVFGNEVAHILADWGRRGFYSCELFCNLLPPQLLTPKALKVPTNCAADIAELSPIFPEWTQFPSLVGGPPPNIFVYGLGWQVNAEIFWASFIIHRNVVTYVNWGQVQMEGQEDQIGFGAGLITAYQAALDLGLREVNSGAEIRQKLHIMLPPNAVQILSSSIMDNVQGKQVFKPALSELEHECKLGLWEFFLERMADFELAVILPTKDGWDCEGPLDVEADFQAIESSFKKVVRDPQSDIREVSKTLQRRVSKRRNFPQLVIPPAKSSRSWLPLGPPIVRTHTEILHNPKGRKRLRVTDECAADIRFIAPECNAHPFAKVFVVHDRQGLRYWRCEMGCYVANF
jgi:ribonuclease HI/exonuclease III